MGANPQLNNLRLVSHAFLNQHNTAQSIHTKILSSLVNSSLTSSLNVIFLKFSNSCRLLLPVIGYLLMNIYRVSTTGTYTSPRRLINDSNGKRLGLPQAAWNLLIIGKHVRFNDDLVETTKAYLSRAFNLSEGEIPPPVSPYSKYSFYVNNSHRHSVYCYPWSSRRLCRYMHKSSTTKLFKSSFHFCWKSRSDSYNLVFET